MASSATDATRLAEIAARCERTTKGPWVVRKSVDGLCSFVADRDGNALVGLFFDDTGGVLSDEDADFIAHAREDVPWLLGQLAVIRKAYSTAKAAAELAIHDLDCCGGDSLVPEEWLKKLVSLVEETKGGGE